MAQLAADPDYQAKRAAIEEEMDRRDALWREAEAPLVEDLRAAGFQVETAWDLVNTSDPYPDALPILLEHVQRDYPDRVKEGIASALAVRDAAFGWDVLKREYQKATGPDTKQGLAAALSVTATRETENQLIELIDDPKNGGSRLLLLRGLRDLRTRRSRDTLDRLLTHELLGKEARHLRRGGR